jgi:hypothetical protein
MKKLERKKEPAGKQIEHTHMQQLTTKFVDAHTRNNNIYSERERERRQYE